MRKDIAHTATLVLSLSLAIEFSSAWARPGTDGKWTVKVITESGGCNQVSRYPVIIETDALDTAALKSSPCPGR